MLKITNNLDGFPKQTVKQTNKQKYLHPNSDIKIFIIFLQ